VCDPAQADSVTECGSTWPKMAFVSHPRLVTTALARPHVVHTGSPCGWVSSATCLVTGGWAAVAGRGGRRQYRGRRRPASPSRQRPTACQRPRACGRRPRTGFRGTRRRSRPGVPKRGAPWLPPDWGGCAAPRRRATRSPCARLGRTRWGGRRGDLCSREFFSRIGGCMSTRGAVVGTGAGCCRLRVGGQALRRTVWPEVVMREKLVSQGTLLRLDACGGYCSRTPRGTCACCLCAPR